MDSTPKIIIGLVVLVGLAVLAAAVAWWWGTKEEPAAQTENISLELPAVNPIEQTNPFNNSVYTNPFE